MKVAYISGAYRASTAREKLFNISLARTVAMRYWRQGYAVICPHSNTALFDGVVENEVFLRGDIELLKRSDLCVILPNWRDSEGAREEVKFAKENKIEIRYVSWDEWRGWRRLLEAEFE